jgi:nitrate/TMAO reductase-like tetraheme cytochrome c subunit
MFKRKSEKKTEKQAEEPLEGAVPVQKSRRPNWGKIGIITSIVLIAGIAFSLAGMVVINQSDTNPNFCATCHIMQTNVTSYLTSVNLDHVHEQAGVECKECHNYPLSAEISSGIKFVTGNYAKDENGNVKARKYGDELCTKCHISLDHVATLTDFLFRNPHASHFPDLACSTCHVAHGTQIDYCSTCHSNGGQRMIGEPIEPRGTIGN